MVDWFRRRAGKDETSNGAAGVEGAVEPAPEAEPADGFSEAGFAARAIAAAIRIVATRNETRIPTATAAGSAAVISIVPDAVANTAPIAEAPVTSPRLRDRLSNADTTPR